MANRPVILSPAWQESLLEGTAACELLPFVDKQSSSTPQPCLSPVPASLCWSSGVTPGFALNVL